MKVPSQPNDVQKKFMGKQAGERGGGFLDITEKGAVLGDATILLDVGDIIPKTQLKHGAYYRGRCRGVITVMRWDDKKEKFYYWRKKSGRAYLESIEHREDSKIPDIFDALEEIFNPREEIPLE
jgi:hypothetical protein